MPTFNKENKVKSNFERISIALASPEDIKERSSGEVLKPETVNYRTYKPERDGLFCEKIFGPTKDYECHCGKYKRIRYRGIVCDRCGVEVTEKKVRRERMGHIELTVPVAHIWYFKSAPNKIAALLGIAAKKLESVIYYEKYIVINPGTSGLQKLDLLSEDEYLELLDNMPENYSLPADDENKFVAGMGADLYESYCGSILATMALGAAAYSAISVEAQMKAILAPMIIAATGVALSIIGIYVVRTKEGAGMDQLLKSLGRGTNLSSLLIAAATFGIM